MPAALSDQLRQAVLAASARPEVLQAVAGVYEQLQRNIDSRQPVCQASGRCCRFEEYGHRLYVTTMELAAFAHNLRSASTEVRQALAHWAGGNGDTCPFQIGQLCGVHPLRPFGCRVFFCDPTATQWQQEQYELFHRQLKRLHQSLSIQYFYLEWRQALRWGDFSCGSALTSSPG